MYVNLGPCNWFIPRVSVELQPSSRRKRLIARLKCAPSSRRNTDLGASPINTAVSVHQLSNQLRFSRMNIKRNFSSKEKARTVCKGHCFERVCNTHITQM